MKKIVATCLIIGLIIAPAVLLAQDKVPAGSEEIVIDSMSKAKEAAGKKVLKGPVPLKHQAHVNAGSACGDCHHKAKEGETPKPCGNSECHTDKSQGQVLKLQDAFHGKGDLPSIHSCIGCHKRVVYEKDKTTTAPIEQKPCETCHSLQK